MKEYSGIDNAVTILYYSCFMTCYTTLARVSQIIFLNNHQSILNKLKPRHFHLNHKYLNLKLNKINNLNLKKLLTLTINHISNLLKKMINHFSKI